MITHNPLLSLPDHVLGAIFGSLAPQSLALCSQVCTAWRDLPYDYLPQRLLVQAGPQANGILEAGLHRARNVHTLCVSSSKEPIWPSFAAALSQQPLPALRELHIQHSSHTDAAQLEQLRTILQVQGPQCSLHLALTDKASLQALLPLLPLPGLASLELNVPYIPDGALQLLLHAATVQAEALQRSSSSSGTTARLPQPTSSAHHQDLVQLSGSGPYTHQQGVLRVGLWVCCWGGCPGLGLAEAVALHGKLHELPCCRMTGCEAINITSTADMQALAQLQGLEALGIFFVNGGSSKAQQGRHGSSQQPEAAGTGSAEDAGEAWAEATTAAAAAEGAASSAGSSAGLGVLATLAGSLKQLSIRGSPPAGWGLAASGSCTPTPQQAQSSPAVARPQLQQHALAMLTGLTKLSLQKDWARPALPVGPIAALTLLQELALERHSLQHPAELSCLGALTNLRVLSLVLTVTADELLEAAQDGSWQLPAGGGAAHWLQRQERDCAAVLDRLSVLKVQDSTGAEEAMECDARGGGSSGGSASCSCCCNGVGLAMGGGSGPGAAGSGQSGVQADSGSLGGDAAGGAAEMLQEVLACPVCSSAVPVLLDWEWLGRLQQLETAWLQVPHLDLTCLPSSLIELDAQQPRDLTRVSITCSHSRGIELPRLQRLVLPHLLQPTEQQPGMILNDAGVPVAAAPCDPTSMGSNSSGRSSSDADCSSTDGCDEDGMQQHWEAAVLLSLVLGAPELKELELVLWQPPSACVVAAARGLRWLRLLSLVAPDGVEGEQLQQNVAAVRAQQQLRAVDMQLQEPLVLSSYPWSSVLSAR